MITANNDGWLETAYWYWKDVITGQPVGTSQGVAIAEAARDADIAAGATEQHANDTYNLVLSEANPDALYPEEKKQQLYDIVVTVTVLFVAAALLVLRSITKTVVVVEK